MGRRGHAGYGSRMAIWAGRARCAGSAGNLWQWGAGSRDERRSPMRAPGRPAAGHLTPRTLALLTTLTARGESHRYKRIASRRPGWSPISLLADTSSSSGASCCAASNGMCACRDDLRRSSVRVSERGRPLELGNGSTHLCEGSHVHAGRARVDMLIVWAHLSASTGERSSGAQKIPEDTPGEARPKPCPHTCRIGMGKK